MVYFICDIIMNITITLKHLAMRLLFMSKMAINYNAIITYYTTIVYNLL